MARRAQCALALLLPWLVASAAHAQLDPGDIRLFLDTDVLSVGVVKAEPRGPAPQTKTTVVGVGHNQLGSSRAVLPTTPLGLGVAYVLKPKWMLGVRAGLGFDRVSVEDGADQKALALSLMPEVTFVPLGDDTKLFVKGSTIAQYNRVEQGSTEQHIFMGCFSIGAGGFLFRGATSSIDLGAFFEGRFGNLKIDPGSGEVDVDDLRGILRMGLSLWT